jgi:hypothetical protein
MARFTVTTRVTGRVDRDEYASLDEAFDALGACVNAHAGERRPAVQAFAREIAPVAQVAVRVEVSGPRVRGGVDIRGDGSTEAYTGRWVRRVVPLDGNETAVQALRRAVSPAP